MLVSFNPSLTNNKYSRNNCCGGKKVAFGNGIDYSQITRPAVARSLVLRLRGRFEEKTPEVLGYIEAALKQPNLHPDAQSYLTSAKKLYA